MTDRPLLLRPDNFTPTARTPWGGTRIVSKYKRDVLGSAPPGDVVVGESWELSVEPDFPSRVEPDGTLLADALGGATTSLLVKLLDAAEDLSVQIHPGDEYDGLGPSESGKPESWYVLDANPGAGIYFGLRDGATEERMEHACRGAGGEDVRSLLFFVPVAPGDFFVVAAGTPHAVGAGLTLVEPQRVSPGKRGVTYRYWDWGRRYGPGGERNPAGAPRALHLEEALAVTAWSAPREEALLRGTRHRAGVPDRHAPARREALSGAGGPVSSPALEVSRLIGTGTLESRPRRDASRHHRRRRRDHARSERHVGGGRDGPDGGPPEGPHRRPLPTRRRARASDRDGLTQKPV